MQQAAYLAWRNPRVQMIAQYLWQDERIAGGKRYTGWQSGLLTLDGEPKPALAHFDDPMWVDLRAQRHLGPDPAGHRARRRGPGPPAGRRHRVADASRRVRTTDDGSWFLADAAPALRRPTARCASDGRTTGHATSPRRFDRRRRRSRGPRRTRYGLPVERREVAPVEGRAASRRRSPACRWSGTRCPTTSARAAW